MGSYQQILRLIREIAAIHRSRADAKFKYSRIFRLYNGELKPLLEREDIDLVWVDPDTSYEADADALVAALGALEKNVYAVHSALSVNRFGRW